MRLPIVRVLLAGILCFLGTSQALFADVANGGRSAFEFLKISPITRAIGLGGAYTALGDDVGAIYYNPAGLASLLTSELNVTYLALYQSMNYESATFAYPLGESMPDFGGTAAIGINFLQPGNIARTNDQGQTVNGNGTFSSADEVFTFSYARMITSGVHAGLSVSYMQQQIDTITSSLFEVNGGVIILPPFDGMRIGVTLKNMGSQSLGFNLPFSLDGGISYRHYEIFNEQDDGALTAEVTLPVQPIEDPVGVKVGAEYDYKWVSSRVALRVGYEFLNTSLNGVGLALGAGYGLDLSGTVLFLDYAYAPADIFGSAHRISLTTKF